ncbi:MAG: hypothetical protein AAGA20_22265 [Planctomycetota bacterium]
MSLLLALCLASTPSDVQETPLPIPFQLPTASDRPVLFDEPGDGQIWALGADWKASFGPEGVLYVPITGSASIPTRPVRFQLSGATLAGRALDATAPTRTHREGQSVRMERGAFDEVWHLAPNEIEQTFVLHELPERGELVLSVDVETERSGRAVDRALRLESPGGAVRYGAAIAIDGAGRRVDVERVPTATGFELRVDAAFVEGASLPLVVDPIVSNTFTVAAANRPQRHPDAAYGRAHAGSGNQSSYTVVWEELAGGLDVDILSVEVDESGAVIPGTQGIVDASTFICQRPKVAYHRGEEMWMVVYERSVTDGATWHVSNRRRRLNSNGHFQQGNVTGVSSGDGRNPDVAGFDGGENVTGQAFTIVWEDDRNGSWDIYYRRLAPAGGIINGGPFQLTSGPDDDLGVDISRTTGFQFSGLYWHNVVWTRNPASAAPNVFGRRITTNGIALTGEVKLNSTPTASGVAATETLGLESSSDVSNLYSVVYGAEVDGVRKTFEGQAGNAVRTGGTDVAAAEDLGDGETRLHHRIARVGSSVAIAYSVDAGSSIELRATAGRLHRRHSTNTFGLGLSERGVFVADELEGPDEFAIASVSEGGGVGESALFVWSSDGIVRGALYEAPGTTLTPILGHQYCQATANSTGKPGWMMGFGTSSTLTSKELVAHDLPAGAFGYLVVGSTSGLVSPAGSEGDLCVGGALGRYIDQIQAATPDGTMSFNVDPQALPQTNGPIVVQPGENWHFQTWHRDAVNGVVTSNFTNALELSFQ